MTDKKIRIAGVNDEPSPSWDLDEGLDVLDELGIKFIELRAAYGEMVDQMNDDTFIRVADRVKERGFTVTTYLGQVGRTVPDEANRAQDISHIIRAVQRANVVGTLNRQDNRVGQSVLRIVFRPNHVGDRVHHSKTLEKGDASQG